MNEPITAGPTTPQQCGPIPTSSVSTSKRRRRTLHRPRASKRGFATAEDLCAFVSNSHAMATIVRAELDTLILLASKIAESSGVDELDGSPLVDWFMGARPKMLGRHLLAVGDTDPEFAEYLQRHLDKFRGQAGPTSMLQPPED